MRFSFNPRLLLAAFMIFTAGSAGAQDTSDKAKELLTDENVQAAVARARQVAAEARGDEPVAKSRTPAEASEEVNLAKVDPDQVPPPRPVEPRSPRDKEEPAMEITSDESELDNEKRLAIFTGNVFLDHPGFKLRSDRLDVFLNDEETEEKAAAADADMPPFKKAIATGGMVVIERLNPQGKTEVAKARRAEYDGSSGDMILKGGPPTLQSGGSLVEPQSNDAEIHLLADGTYTVKGGSGAKGGSKIIIPLKGKKSSGPSLPTNLKGISGDRN